MRVLDIRPDLPRRGMRGQERPKKEYPPLWRGTLTHRIDGPDAWGRYRLSSWGYNSYCRLEQYGPTRVCVMDDHGFLVDVGLEGDIR